MNRGRKGSSEMSAGRVIRVIAVTEGIKMTEIAEGLGISRQALYHRLEGNMSYESFRECLKVMGYELYYGKDGEVKKI